MSLNQSIKVLFITPEITPLLKTGGLADVSAALPAALRDHKVDVRVLLPGYPRVMDGLKHKRLLATLTDTGVHGEVKLLEAELPGSGVPLLVIDYPPFYERDGGPYLDHNGLDWVDNAQRFALLSKVGSHPGQHKIPIRTGARILCSATTGKAD